MKFFLFLSLIYFLQIKGLWYLHAEDTKDLEILKRISSFNSYQFNKKDLKLEFPSEEVIIDWTNGIILVSINSNNTAWVDLNFLKTTLKKQNLNSSIVNSFLLEKAKIKLIHTVLNMNFNAHTKVKDLYHSSNFKASLLHHISNNIIQYPVSFFYNKYFEKSISYPIYGKNSLSSFLFKYNSTYLDKLSHKRKNLLSFFSFQKEKKEKLNHYTSLVIDLRYSFKFNPLLVADIDLPKDFKVPLELKYKINYNPLLKQIEIKNNLTKLEKELLRKIYPKNLYYQYKLNEIFSSVQKFKKKSLNFKPSLFPNIYASSGELIYSPSKLPLDNINNKKGFINYITNILDFYNQELVGQKPYFLVANRISGKYLSNIILTDELAKPFFLNPANIKKLHEGKIFLLVN